MAKTRIAYIIDGSLENPKGLVNACLARIAAQKALGEFKVDVYSLQLYESWLFRFLCHGKKKNRPSSVVVNGIPIKLWWSKSTLLNYILDIKLHKKPLGIKQTIERFAKSLKDYDLITAHSLECSEIAKKAKELYGVPYTSSWYGTDIHTSPFVSEQCMKRTISVIEDASHNFFVSKALMHTSDRITTNTTKSVLYVGLRNMFYKRTEVERAAFAERYAKGDKKVVAFSGNFFHVKNVLKLPLIFKLVMEKYPNVVFWLTGDGKLREQMEAKFTEFGVPYKIWGYLPENEIPEFLNCVDVQVLPSKNEGLPMITVEAMACGAKVVGSNVGGIPEVVGEENVFELDESFEEKLSNRIVELLISEYEQEVPSVFSWENNAIVECDVYRTIISGKSL